MVALSTAGPGGAGSADLLAASYSQRRIFARVHPRRYADNVSRSWRLRGALDARALERALNGVVARHEPLRTGLETIAGRLRQVVYDEVPPLVLRRIDLATVPRRRRARALTRLAIEEAEAPFSLSSPPPARATLVRLGARDHVLLLVVGHVIWDAASTPVFERDLLALYDERVTGLPAGRPPIDLTYADLAAAADVRDHAGYWSRALAGGSPYAPPAISRHGGGGERRLAWERFPPVSRGFVERLTALSRSERATLNIAVLAAFTAALAAMCDTEELTVAIEHANRDLPGTELIIGFCIDAVLIVTSLAGRPTFRALLQRTRDQVFASFERRTPIAAQLELVAGGRALDELPAMHELVFNFIPPAPGVAAAAGGLRVTRLHTPKRGYSPDASWPDATLLTSILPTRAGALTAYAEFDPQVVGSSFVRELGRRLEAWLEAASTWPDREVGELDDLVTRRLARAPTAERGRPRRDWAADDASARSR